MIEQLTRWTRPESYAGASWYEYYSAGFGQSRGCDCLTESNFAVALKALGGESDTVRVVHERHWLVGWVEWIAIHESDTKSQAIALELRNRHEAYPVLDEDDFSQREHEEASRIWRECYDDAERIQFMRDHLIDHHFESFTELRQHVRGEFFAGYASDLGVL